MAYVSDSGKRTAPSRKSVQGKRRPARTKPPTHNAPRPVQTPPGGDIASSGGDYGTRKAKQFAATRANRKAVRQTYAEQTPARRKQIATASQHRPGPAAAVVRHEHASRLIGNLANARANRSTFIPGATKEQYQQRAAREQSAKLSVINLLHPGISKQAAAESGGDFGTFDFDRGQIKRSGGNWGTEGLTPDQIQAQGVNVSTSIPLHGAISKALGLGAASIAETGIKDAKVVKDALSYALGESKPARAITTTAGRATKDAVDITGNFVPNLYKAGETLTTETAKHGPEAGLEKTAQEQIVKPYGELIKHPGKAFSEHPLGSTLMVAAPLRAADQIAGRAMRSGALGKGAVNVASRAKPVSGRTGTALRETPLYPKGVVEKHVVKAYEAVSNKRSAKKAAKAGEPNPTARIMSDPQVNTRVDEFFGAHEHIRRNNVAATHKAVTDAIGRKATPSQILAAQNIIDPNKGALIKEHTRLSHQHEMLLDRYQHAPSPDGAARIAQSEKNLEALQKEIDKADPELFDEKGLSGLEGYKSLSAGLQQKLGALTGQQEGFLSRSVQPYAIAKMRAKREPAHVIDTKTGKKLSRGEVSKLRRDLTGKEFSDRVQKVPERLVNEYGPLSTEDVLAHMMENNVSMPAWVSHAPGRKASGAYYQPSAQAPNLGPRGTSGQAQIQGTFDLSNPHLLHESAVRATSLASTAQSFTQFLREFGVRDKNGKPIQRDNYRDIAQLARDWNERNPNQQVAPVRTNPFGANGDQLHALMEGVRNGEIAHHDAMESIGQKMVNEEGSGPWTLAPAAAVKRAGEHMASQTQTVFDNLSNLYGSQFRKTVLALSPKWMTGNVVEAAFRTLVSDLPTNIPANIYRGYKVKGELKRADPQAYEEFKARVLGGGHGGMLGHIGVYTDAERFAGTKLAGVANAMATLRHAKGAEQIGNFWNHYTDFVFNTLNGNIETGFQTAMLGKALKDDPLMEGRVAKLTGAAFKEAAQGLRNTNNQVRLGRAVDDMFGKYGKFSPGKRRMISRYTPFIAWSLSALKFLTTVLPRDHPIISGIAASVSQANEEWRKDKELGWFLDKHVPDFLQGSVPTGGGAHLRASRYLPFGMAADPLGTLGGQFAPQYVGVVNALKGQDWKGDDLPGKNGPNEMQIRGISAAAALLGVSVPITAQAQRMLLDTSKTTPTGYDWRKEPLGERLRGEFDPFKTTAPTKSESSGKKKYFSSGSDSSGQKKKYFSSGGTGKKKTKYFGGP